MQEDGLTGSEARAGLSRYDDSGLAVKVTSVSVWVSEGTMLYSFRGRVRCYGHLIVLEHELFRICPTRTCMLGPECKAAGCNALNGSLLRVGNAEWC